MNIKIFTHLYIFPLFCFENLSVQIQFNNLCDGIHVMEFNLINIGKIVNILIFFSFSSCRIEQVHI